MKEFMGRVAADRMGGKKPGAPRALGAAIVVGAATGVATYRLLRQ
jgi:hypothetical protein